MVAILEKVAMEFSCVFPEKISKTFRRFRLTTNNRMELLAVIETLEKLKIPKKRSCFSLILNMPMPLTKLDFWLDKKGLKNVKILICGKRFIPLLENIK